MSTGINRREAVVLGIQSLAATSLVVPNLTWAQAAAAEKWPVDTLKMIIPAPAGGGVDTLCRRVGERLAHHLHINVVPDNKPGASGLLGSRATATAAPDGGTIGFLHSGLVSVQAMGGKLDLVKEFRPIVGRFNEGQMIIAVNTDSKYKNLSDLFKDIAANPGKRNYGTGGQGSPGHMVFERLEEKIPGLSAQDVPFKGAAEATNALIGKDLDFLIGVMSTLQVQVKTGRVRALAVTGVTRSAQLPDVPTIAEAGVPGFSFVTWGGFFGPSKFPDRLVVLMQAAISKIVKEPEMMQLIAANGSQVPPTESEADFLKFLRESIVRETAVMTRLGLKAG